MSNISEMVETLGKLDATNCSSEDAIATHVLNKLKGYRASFAVAQQDHEFIKTVIQAYAKLIQDTGVKII